MGGGRVSERVREGGESKGCGRRRSEGSGREGGSQGA